MDTIDGVLDLLSLCWMVIMSNVLDHRTYSAPNQDEYEDASPAELKRLGENDLNAIPQEERLNMVYARGICYDILRWFDAHFTVEDIATGVQRDAFGLRWIATETFKLMRYKETAELQGLQGAAHCTPKMLQHQINNVMQMEITRQVWVAVHAEGISEVEYLGWSTEMKGCVVVHKREVGDSDHEGMILAYLNERQSSDIVSGFRFHCCGHHSTRFL